MKHNNKQEAKVEAAKEAAFQRHLDSDPHRSAFSNVREYGYFDAGYTAALSTGPSVGEQDGWVAIDDNEPPNVGPWQVTFPGVGDELLTGFDFYDGRRGWRYYRNVIAYAPLLAPYQPEGSNPSTENPND